MGTSTGYSAPPSWGNLKGDITRTAGAGRLSSGTAQRLVQSFIEHNGGAAAIARGGTGRRTTGTGGGGVARGGAARQIAGRLGGFIAEVGRLGLDRALERAGWSDLVGRPVPDILAALLDRLGGDASTIDEVDARMALSQLQDKYLGAAANAEELEQILTEQVPRLGTVLQDFFGCYLYEVFCRVFYERLVQRVGETRADSFLGQIKDFLRSTLANRTVERDITDIDWAGQEGAALVSEIMETTLTVFGG